MGQFSVKIPRLKGQFSAALNKQGFGTSTPGYYPA